jgi:hypothetical protein
MQFPSQANSWFRFRQGRSPKNQVPQVRVHDNLWLQNWNGENTMSENEFINLPVPKNSGPELDLLLALHMGWKHWSGTDLPIKMHLDEISKNPSVIVPKLSTDHNAFFDHVAAYFVNLDMEFIARYQVEDQMWQVEIKHENESFVGKDYELPHAGSLAAISALRKSKHS